MTSRDHPRIRGEHHGEVVEVEAAVGIIPAYAGSTVVRPVVDAVGGDHPRIRGEHVRNSFGAYVSVGIIPAYAGSTAIQASNPGFDPDHPRIRGEHVCLGNDVCPSAGIIPAYAGSTLSETDDALREVGSSPHTRGARRTTHMPAAARRDHPRIRGEHLRERVLAEPVDGIIPAYAGSTPFLSLHKMVLLGSSPHTRGAPEVQGDRQQHGGDHPRIRGEHECILGATTKIAGIIPAYAGSTTPSS